MKVIAGAQLIKIPLVGNKSTIIRRSQNADLAICTGYWNVELTETALLKRRKLSKGGIQNKTPSPLIKTPATLCE